MDLICLAAEGEPYGHLRDKFEPLPDSYLIARCHTTKKDFGKFLSELTARERIFRDEFGSLVIPQMVEHEKTRKARADGGSKGGNPAVTRNYNEPGFLYLIRRSSDKAVKIGIAKNPMARFYKIRSKIADPEAELLDTFRVENMGAAEYQLHAEFSDKKVIGEWFSLSDDDLISLKGRFKGNPCETLSSDSPSSGEIEKEIKTSLRALADHSQPREDPETEITAMLEQYGQEFGVPLEPDPKAVFRLAKFMLEHDKSLDDFEQIVRSLIATKQKPLGMGHVITIMEGKLSYVPKRIIAEAAKAR